MIEINDKGSYLGIWYLRGNEQDWMCTVHKLKEAPAWTMSYRFRYYVDPNSLDPFDGQDIKNWYQADLPGKTDEEIVALVDGLMHRFVAGGYTRGTGTKPWRRIVKDRSHTTLTEIVRSAPFTHFSTAEGKDVKVTGKGGSA
jgi:hypothetical protein